jgi:hypothetical protein
MPGSFGKPYLYRSPTYTGERSEVIWLTYQDDRLGLIIQPQAVRLQPAPEDGYSWCVTDSKAHLMKTSLSNGTVGLYDAICQEIGRSIEAVRPSRVPGAILDSDVGCRSKF